MDAKYSINSINKDYIWGYDEWKAAYPQFEIENIYSTAQRLNEVIRNVNRINVVEEVYQLFLDNYESAISIDNCISNLGMVFIENYFIQLFMFINRWEKYWERKDKEKVTKLIDIYQDDALAMAKIIRNYIEHDNIAIHVYSYQSDGLHLLTRKDKLRYDRIPTKGKGKKLYDVLEQQNEEIDILDVAKESLKSAHKYHKVAYMLHNDKQLLDDIGFMKCLMNELDKTDSSVQWGINKDYTDINGNKHFDTYIINWNEYDMIYRTICLG